MEWTNEPMTINFKMFLSENKSTSKLFEEFILQVCEKNENKRTHNIIRFSFDYTVSSGWDVHFC